MADILQMTCSHVISLQKIWVHSGAIIVRPTWHNNGYNNAVTNMEQIQQRSNFELTIDSYEYFRENWSSMICS